tara:strand:- start:309 stop:572 length:264 start_codon:yes stop_codon:yes gene_type:complete
MLKEIKYLIFIVIIILFIFLVGRYYFSDDNKKISFRSFNNIEKKIDISAEKLPVLEDNTKNIIEYVEKSNINKKKKFNFWKLIESNE